MLFAIAPLYVFVIHHRFAVAKAPVRERQSGARTNLALLGITLMMMLAVGLKVFLLFRLTGNIGFHHIQRLSPRIPNCHLQRRCHEADSFFTTIKPVTFLASLKSLTYRLWDEQRQVFVGFRYLKPALL